MCSGGTLTPLQVIAISAGTGAAVDGGGEILDQLESGEPINWSAVLARTAGGAGKGALFGTPGLSGTKLFTGAAAIETAESYLHSAAKGDMSPEALGEAIGNGTISFVTFGLVDKAAKKILSPFMRDKLKMISKSQQTFEPPISEAGGNSKFDWKDLGNGSNIIPESLVSNDMSFGNHYGIDVDNLKFSNTVMNHTGRPYQDSKLLISEIIESKLPVPDKYGTSALSWTVDGTFNGSSGYYELVIDPKSNTVWHFVYKSHN